MSTADERANAKALLDDPQGVIGCDCGCLHYLEVDAIGRPTVRFRCAHPEHRLDGTERVYTNPPNDGAVLNPDAFQPPVGAEVAPLVTSP